MEIQRLPQGWYILATDTESITLTPQDLRDISDWCLLHMREIEQDARQLGDDTEE